jgi:regulator of protease activity HflC (stomatin/prohibitin superfamily)
MTWFIGTILIAAAAGGVVILLSSFYTVGPTEVAGTEEIWCKTTG